MQPKCPNLPGQPGGWLLSFVSPKESNQRKCDPGAPPLRGALRCSTGQAAAELAALRQSSPKPPDQPALLGGAQGRKAGSQNLKSRWATNCPQ